MQLTRPKVIAITLLAVLVALGSASAVVFAPQSEIVSMQLIPNSGCPGTPVTVAVLSVRQSAGGVAVPAIKDRLTSYPDGLITNFDGNSFIVGDSVCAGDYVVTLRFAVDNGVGKAPTIESVSTHFTVGGQGCPGLAPCRPVGGVVMPTNALAIAAPYLALVGLAAVLSTVVLVKRRRD